MNSKNLFLLLSNIEGVGSITTNKLLKAYAVNNSIKDVILALRSLRLKRETICNVDELLNKYDGFLNKHIKVMKQKDITLFDVFSKDNDNILKYIDNCPSYLYSIGKTLDFSRSIAVIGARNCSEYGRKIAYEIGYELASNGFVVTSGMAYGVDAYAHKGALDGGGSTIAVLGSGVDICYPKSNYALYERIKEHGLILSEFGIGTMPSKYTFPLRNRIISGLSSAVIVVEAKEKSGTMITVRYALDQGRQIFAVPGNINSDLSGGTNLLIKNGAFPYTCIGDLIEDLHR